MQRILRAGKMDSILKWMKQVPGITESFAHKKRYVRGNDHKRLSRHHSNYRRNKPRQASQLQRAPGYYKITNELPSSNAHLELLSPPPRHRMWSCTGDLGDKRHKGNDLWGDAAIQVGDAHQACIPQVLPTTEQLKDVRSDLGGHGMGTKQAFQYPSVTFNAENLHEQTRIMYIHRGAFINGKYTCCQGDLQTPGCFGREFNVMNDLLHDQD